MDDPTIVAGAQKEAQLTFYSGADPTVNDALAKVMHDRYGVEVNTLRLTGGPLAQRYAAEAEAGNVTADVIVNGDQIALADWTSKGYLATLDSLPSLATWPKEYWNGNFGVVSIGPCTLTWNTSLVPDGLKDWQDIIDPKWKGQILVNDPRASNTNVAIWLLLRDTYGPDFLRSFAAQEPRPVDSTVPGNQQIAAGAAAFIVTSFHASTAPLIAQGLPLKETFMDPSTGSEQNVAVSAKAPHPNAARALANLILSEDGQRMMNQNSSSPRPNLSGTLPLPPHYSSPRVQEAIAAKAEIFSLLNIH